MAMLERTKKSVEAIISSVTSDERDIEFTYFAPKAKKVSLAGKFNAWNTSSVPMKKSKDGTWRATVKLPPGKHEYKFFVDGVWVHEAACSDKVLNPFGTYNCVIGVS